MAFRTIYALFFCLPLLACGGLFDRASTLSYDRARIEAERAYTAIPEKININDVVRVIMPGGAIGESATVAANGTIQTPSVGPVMIAGLTPEEAAQQIEQLLGRNGVIVELLTNAPIYLVGEVEQTGELPFLEGLTVRRLVELAGGYTYRADESRVFVVRRGVREELEVSAQSAFQFAPGDIVRVPQLYF